MMWGENMIKMIVFDLDGTLLDINKKVSFMTKQYLKELKEKGYIIAIATGRIYALALKATDNAEFASFVISDTGACIYDQTNGEPIYAEFIRPEIAQQLLEYKNDDWCYTDICNKEKIYRYSDDFRDSTEIITVHDKTYIKNHCEQVSHITICMKNNEAVIKLYNELTNKFSELEIIIMQDSFSSRKWIEMMAKGNSKYNSIKRLANHLGIKNEEIMVFGDGLNDIEMLEKSGYGVALKNALPEVKAKAKDVTKFDYNHDGVMHFLKDFLNR